MSKSTRATHGLRSNYPRPTQINRAIRAVRENGVKVSSVELRRDGTIRLGDQTTASPETLFDALDRANKL